MAKLAGKGATVKVDNDGGGSPAELLGVTGWTLNTNADTVDVTTLDDDGAKTFIAACTEWNGTVDGVFDTDEADIFATAGPTPPLVSVGLTVELELYPIATDAACMYSGDAIVTAFNPTVEVNGSVSWSMSFQGTGTLAYPALTP